MSNAINLNRVEYNIPNTAPKKDENQVEKPVQKVPEEDLQTNLAKYGQQTDTFEKSKN